MRHAIHRLARDRGLTVLSLVNSLHRPLPVRDAGRLVVLATGNQGAATGSEGMEYRFTYPALADFRSQARSFTDLIAFNFGRI